VETFQDVASLAGLVAFVVGVIWLCIREEWRASQLRKHGTPGVATILSVKQAGSSDDGPYLEFRAKVAPVGGVAFDARFKGAVELLDVHRMQRGQKLYVFFDPKDRKRVTLASKYLVEPDAEPESESDPDPVS
jgi:hypothetical protein